MSKRVTVEALNSFSAVDAAWRTNIGGGGRIKNLALSRRLADRERDLAIIYLGFDPEDRSSYGTRYAATNGELRRWAEEALRERIQEGA